MTRNAVYLLLYYIFIVYPEFIMYYAHPVLTFFLITLTFPTFSQEWALRNPLATNANLEDCYLISPDTGFAKGMTSPGAGYHLFLHHLPRHSASTLLTDATSFIT